MSVTAQPGGIFNSYKINYSPETHQLLKVLIDEAKLTTTQRRQIKESLANRKPLPTIPKSNQWFPSLDGNVFDMKKNYYFARRSRDQIIYSGAYERDRFNFLNEAVDHEKEKQKLQDLMAYGKKSTKNNTKINNSHVKKTTNTEVITPEKRVEELLQEIDDRIVFLKEMETLGKKKNYEFIIKQEIASKCREIEKLDPQAFKTLKF